MKPVLVDCVDGDEIEQQMAPYLKELSQFESLDSFDYPYPQFYWRQPDRFPYLIKDEDNTAGFALVRKISSGTAEPDVHSIAEFYIQPASRGKDIGKAAATEILSRSPGPWLVQVLEHNLPAKAFWQKVLSEITGQTLEPVLIGRFFDFKFQV